MMRLMLIGPFGLSGLSRTLTLICSRTSPHWFLATISYRAESVFEQSLIPREEYLRSRVIRARSPASISLPFLYQKIFGFGLPSTSASRIRLCPALNVKQSVRRDASN